MKYLLSSETRQHIAIHFGKQEKAGSCFYPEVFPAVDDLLFTLEKRNPHDIILQAAGREAHTYNLSDIGACGSLGLGFKAEYADQKIVKENRNGLFVEYAEAEELPSTSLVTVICSRDNDVCTLITVFPGGYAPAFPHNGMEPEELSRAVAFWDQYILLKKR